MCPKRGEGDVRTELYARGELPPPAETQCDKARDELTRLAEQGVVDAVSFDTWEKRVPTDNCGDDLRDTYLAFQTWATTEGVHLTPFFGTRECYDADAGELTDWLVFPALCLAIYENGELTAVYPHDDGEPRTVEDGLARLRDYGRASADVQTAAGD